MSADENMQDARGILSVVHRRQFARITSGHIDDQQIWLATDGWFHIAQGLSVKKTKRQTEQTQLRGVQDERSTYPQARRLSRLVSAQRFARNLFVK